jgi:hypothetical protein
MEGEEPVPTGGGGGQGNLTRLLVCHSQAGCIIGKCAIPGLLRRPAMSARLCGALILSSLAIARSV